MGGDLIKDANLTDAIEGTVAALDWMWTRLERVGIAMRKPVGEERDKLEEAVVILAATVPELRALLASEPSPRGEELRKDIAEMIEGAP